MTDLILDSLQRRMAAMHSLYYQAVDTMGLEHVNHFEREGVLPIAFSLFHYTNMEDASFMLITGVPPVWDDVAGQGADDHQRPRQAPDRGGDGRPAHRRLRGLQVLPAPGLRPDRGPAGRLDPADLARVVIERPFPPQIASTYSARVAAPDQGITVLDATECWLYQHGLRHMGEIELARGLVGLGGMTS